MILIQLKQPAEMEASHRAARRARPAAQPSPRPRNVEPVLSIGEMTFFQFRGRAYGVPPLPWKAGQRLLDAHMRALETMATLAVDPYDKTARTSYYTALGQVSALLWRNCRPTGKARRFLRWARLLRNPFGNATDGEILEHADFFLARRMKSGVQSPQAASHPRATSSTIS